MKIFISLLVLVMFGTSGTALAVPGDLGWRFIHNTITVRDLAPSFSGDFGSAGTDFSNAGNLSFLTGPSHLNPPYSSHVAFQEANYGAVTWAGRAIGYTASNQPCADPNTGILTGNCTLSNGVDYAWIRFNSFHGPYSTAQRANLIRHEFGHILGLSHSSACSPTDSVMAPSLSCSPLRTTLQPADTNLINSWYP